ncbi:hypothetical protein LCGC14_2532060, partial [marine sediment metagenome]
ASGRGHDGLMTPSDRDAIHQTVRNAYRLAGAEDNYEYVQHGGGHIFLWEPAESFLKRHL